METKTERLLWADLLRVIAVFLVIMLHAAMPTTAGRNFNLSSWFTADNLCQSLVRVAIPIFVMLSGALNLGKETSAAYFFKRRFLKVAVPLLAWHTIYILWRGLFYGDEIGLGSFTDVLTGHVYRHLWFLYMVLALYLFTPPLRVFVQAASTRTVAYVVLLWFLLKCVFPTAAALAGIELAPKTWTVFFSYYHLVGGFLGYYLLGHLLVRFDVFRRLVPIAAAGYLLGFLLTSVGTYYINIGNAGKTDYTLHGYFTPNIVLMSLSLFVLFRNLDFALFKKAPALTRAAVTASNAVFGVYLVHILFLTLITTGAFGFTVGAYYHGPAVGIPLTALVCAAMSFVVVVLMKKIPVLKAIVP